MSFPGLRLASRLPAAVCLLAALPALAATSFDLNRETPVPADQPIPVADFFRYSLIRSPDINRAGTRLCALYAAGGDHVALMIFDLNKFTFEWLPAPGEDRDVTSCRWLDDDNLVWSLSEPHTLMAVDVRETLRAHPLLQFDTSWVIGIPEKSRLEPLVWIRSDSFNHGDDVGVARIDSQRHKGHLIPHPFTALRAIDSNQARDGNRDHIIKSYPLPGPDRVIRYLTDMDGELAFAITSRNGVPTLHRLAGDHWETCPIDLDKIDVVDCGNQPGELIVRGPRGTGAPRPLEFMDAATGTPGNALLVLKGRDFSGSVYREPVHHVAIGVQFDATGPQSAWFAPEYTALQELLARDENLKGMAIRILGSDLAQHRFLVGAFSDRVPISYYLVDLEKRGLHLIRHSRPWIDPARMAPTNVIQYKTREGHTFDAYITLPRGASKERPAPLVVLTHGPYEARATWGFSGETQFLASRGYAVLEPNVRGDSGYGWQFSLAEEWDLRRMSDDVTDAVRAVLKTGYVDPARVAIMGSEDGAHLALSGAVFDPDLYRCCIVVDAIVDFGALIKDQKYFQYDSSFYATALRFLGNPSEVPEKFQAMTPAAHVDRLKAATLVAYRRADKIGESQSGRLNSELQRHGVVHESLAVGDPYPGRGHLQNQVEIYRAIEAFLAKHLAP